MRINPARLVGISHARQNFSTLLSEVENGKTIHVMRDSSVIAHVVPAKALIIDTDNVESALLLPAVKDEAKWFACEVMQRGYEHAGDNIGRLLGWLWSSDPEKALRWFLSYARVLTAELRDNDYMRPAFGPLWRSLSIGLSVLLPDGDIKDFETYVRRNLFDWDTELFTTAELAGSERRRDRDDPWPDASEHHSEGSTKRRWCHLTAGHMIPNPSVGHNLPISDDHWCRIEEIVGPNAVLLQNDGSKTEMTMPDVSTWIPTRTEEPWRWGMSRYV